MRTNKCKTLSKTKTEETERSEKGRSTKTKKRQKSRQQERVEGEETAWNKSFLLIIHLEETGVSTLNHSGAVSLPSCLRW